MNADESWREFSVKSGNDTKSLSFFGVSIKLVGLSEQRRFWDAH